MKVLACRASAPQKARESTPTNDLSASRDPAAGCSPARAVVHGRAPPLIIISQCNRKCTRFFGAGRELLKGQGAAPAAPRAMLYQAYQAQSDIMVPVRAWAGMALHAFGSMNGVGNGAVNNLTAAYELIARAGLTHTRPPFGIDTVTVGNEKSRCTRRQRRHAIRDAAALPQGHRHAAAAHPAGRAVVWPFRDTVAQHREDTAAGARRLHHRLAQRARRAASRMGASASTNTSST